MKTEKNKIKEEKKNGRKGGKIRKNRWKWRKIIEKKAKYKENHKLVHFILKLAFYMCWGLKVKVYQDLS